MTRKGVGGEVRGSDDDRTLRGICEERVSSRRQDIAQGVSDWGHHGAGGRGSAKMRQ